MWHIYTMEYYAAIRNDEFMSFIGTWMNLENIILSKLTQERKMKHCIFSLIGWWWKMRTHGHREGRTKHWGLLGGKGEGQWEGEVGRDSLGRNAKCGWRGESKPNTLPCVYLCNCIACSAHVPQNLKCNKKTSGISHVEKTFSKKGLAIVWQWPFYNRKLQVSERTWRNLKDVLSEIHLTHTHTHTQKQIFVWLHLYEELEESNL